MMLWSMERSMGNPRLPLESQLTYQCNCCRDDRPAEQEEEEEEEEAKAQEAQPTQQAQVPSQAPVAHRTRSRTQQ